MSRRSVTIAGAVLLAGAAALAGCTRADVGQGGATAGGQSPTDAARSSCVTKADQILAAAEKPPNLSVPQISGGVAALRGKSVWFVADTTATLLADQGKGARAALQAAGLKVTLFNAQSAVDKENQAINEAVGAHAAAIVIDAINTQKVSGALANASAAGIPVVSVYEKPNTPQAERAVKATVFLDGRITGRWMAASLLSETGCNADTGMLYNKLYSLHTAVLPAVRQLYAQLCPKTCKLTTAQYNLESVSTTVGPQAVSLVASHPGMNSMLLATDDLTTTAVSALRTSGKTGLAVVSEGGDPEALALMQPGGLLRSDIVNASNDFVGWTAGDTVLRLLSGKPAASNDTFFVRMFTQKTLPKDRAQYFPFQDYRTRFEKAWGVK